MDNKIQDYISLGLKNSKLIKLLISTIKTHEIMEKTYATRLKTYISDEKFINEKSYKSYINYLEKNFFSILLLSIFKNLKISKDKITEYGIILHSLRGMVTCADNIIDKESKGSIFLTSISNHVLSNTMLSIIQQNIINNSIDELTIDSYKKNRMIQGYTKALYSVALGENLRELGQNIEEPKEIIENIHKKIGGELLQLAFVIPSINEENEILNQAKDGIFQIGIALQLLDDICDFKEDLDENKKNYLLSKISHKNNLNVLKIKEISNNENFIFSEVYLDSYRESINEAVETALYGFELLGNSGYPINRNQGELILKFMFNIRGLSKAWDFYKNK